MVHDAQKVEILSTSSVVTGGQGEPRKPDLTQRHEGRETDTKPRSTKPSVEQLGIDPDRQTWRRSGDGPGAVEIAFTGEWVLMRVAGDPEARILVYDHFEWECFLDGAKKGEFDYAV